MFFFLYVKNIIFLMILIHITQFKLVSLFSGIKITTPDCDNFSKPSLEVANFFSFLLLATLKLEFFVLLFLNCPIETGLFDSLYASKNPEISFGDISFVFSKINLPFPPNSPEI